MILTTNQAARTAGVSVSTVVNWCNAGALPCWRVACGTHRRIDRAKLIDFLEKNKMPVFEPEPEAI